MPSFGSVSWGIVHCIVALSVIHYRWMMPDARKAAGKFNSDIALQETRLLLNGKLRDLDCMFVWHGIEGRNE